MLHRRFPAVSDQLVHFYGMDPPPARRPFRRLTPKRAQTPADRPSHPERQHRAGSPPRCSRGAARERTERGCCAPSTPAPPTCSPCDGLLPGTPETSATCRRRAQDSSIAPTTPAGQTRRPAPMRSSSAPATTAPAQCADRPHRQRLRLEDGRQGPSCSPPRRPGARARARRGDGGRLAMGCSERARGEASGVRCRRDAVAASTSGKFVCVNRIRFSRSGNDGRGGAGSRDPEASIVPCAGHGL